MTDSEIAEMKLKWLDENSGDMRDRRSIVVVGWIDDRTGQPVISVSPHSLCIHVAMAVQEGIVTQMAAMNFAVATKMHMTQKSESHIA